MRGHSEQPSGGGEELPTAVDFDEDFFQRMVAAASDAVVTVDGDGTVVYANEAVEDVLGYAPGEMCGRQFLEFVPERLRDRYAGWFDRYVDGDGGTPLDDETYEVRGLTADGEERRLSVSGFAHGTDDRRLFTGFVRPVRETAASTERLREEEALVEEIFDASPVAFTVRDAQGDLVRANERAAELAGVGSDRPLSDADETWTVYDTDGEPLPESQYPVSRALETGEPVYNDEVIVEQASGKRVHLSVSAAPVRDGDEVRRVVTVAEDVTELKETQIELERRHEELETELSEVFSRITDAFIALNDDWEFTYVNEEAEELLRREECDLVGESVWEAFAEAQGTRFQEEYERAMETQEPVSFVEHYPPLSTWFEVRAYPSESGLSIYFQDVTERIERERELERYETIIETVDDGIYAAEADGTLSMVNDAFTDITGYGREELIGTNARRFYDEDVEETVERRQREMLAGERSSGTVEHDLETADGETIRVEVTFVVHSTDDGHERVGVLRDITERRERERELQDRIKQQRAVASFSQAALADRSLDGLFDEAAELVSETLDHDYCKVLELRPEDDELLLRNGVGWREGVVGSATVADDSGSQAGYTLASEEPVVVEDLDAEDRFSGPELLTSHDVTSGISTVIGSSDEPWGVLGTHDTDGRTYADHDVQFVQSIAHILTTAIHRREREQQLERYETIVETVEDGVYALNPDEEFVMVNDAFCEMTGYDREELLGRHASVVHSEDVNERAGALSDDVADELGSATLEFELRTKDGDALPVESRFGPYRYDDRSVARTGVVRDITERKERERELRERNERLDAFASMLAHELRNPLEIAQIYLDMGVENATVGSDAASAFREVEHALDRIEEMIDTLLVVTRRGGSVDTTEAVDLGERAREWWADLDPEGTLEVQTDREILADASRLRQLLENLYRNAVEHGSTSPRSQAQEDAVEHGSASQPAEAAETAGQDPPGSERGTDVAAERGETGVTVRVGDVVSDDGDPVGFYVADDGPGIPPAEREQVFEPGYSTSNVGIGFGLSVVEQLVEAHDWDCNLTESERGGARFEFTGVETPGE